MLVKALQHGPVRRDPQRDPGYPPGLPPLELHTPVMDDVPAFTKHVAAFSCQADRADGEAWAAANGVPAAQRPSTWEPEPSTSQKKLLMQSLAWGDADALSKAARRMGILWESSGAAKFTQPGPAPEPPAVAAAAALHFLHS